MTEDAGTGLPVPKAVNSHSLAARGRGRNVPVHEAVPKSAILFMGKRLGEHVSKLFRGGHMFDGDSSVNNMLTEVVEADREMFGATARFMVRGYLNTTLIVFKNARNNTRCGSMEGKSTLFQFFQEVLDSNNFLKGRRECNIFSLGCAECNKGLDFG